jgi:hypothetical protein
MPRFAGCLLSLVLGALTGCESSTTTTTPETDKTPSLATPSPDSRAIGKGKTTGKHARTLGVPNRPGPSVGDR